MTEDEIVSAAEHAAIAAAGKSIETSLAATIAMMITAYLEAKHEAQWSGRSEGQNDA